MAKPWVGIPSDFQLKYWVSRGFPVAEHDIPSDGPRNSVMLLVLHLVVGWGLEVIILILVILLWKLLGSLREVNLASTGASSIGDDVVGVDLLHVVVISLIN